MDKNADLAFNISATANQYSTSKIRFSTQDEGSAKLTFFLFKEGVELPLNGVTGKIAMRMADGSKFLDVVTLTDKQRGIVEYKLIPEQLKHFGQVVAELYLNYMDGQKISVHRFSFRIDQALIDTDIVPTAEYYISDFETMKQAIESSVKDIRDNLSSLEVYNSKLNSKATKGEITKADMDASADSKKLGLENLNDAARQAIAGNAPVFSGLKQYTVVEEYFADGAVSTRAMKEGSVTSSKLSYIKLTIASATPMFKVDWLNMKITITSGHFMLGKDVIYYDTAVESSGAEITGLINSNDVYVVVFDFIEKAIKYIKYNTSLLNRYGVIFFIRAGRVYGQDNIGGIEVVSSQGKSRQITIEDLPNQLLRTRKANFVGRQKVKFDFTKNEIEFGEGFISIDGGTGTKDIPTDWRKLTSIPATDGVHTIFWDDYNRKFLIYKYDQFSVPMAMDRLWYLCSYYGGVYKKVIADFPYEIIDTKETNVYFNDSRLQYTFLMPQGVSNFNLVDKKITIYGGFVITGNTYSTPLVRELTGVEFKDGISWLYYNMATRTFGLAHYTDRSLMTMDCYIVATLYYTVGTGVLTVNASFPYTINGVFPNTNNTTPVEFADGLDRLLAPLRFYLVEGDTLPIYKSSIMSSVETIDIYKIGIRSLSSDSTPTNKYIYEDYTLNPANLPTSIRMFIAQKKNYAKFYYRDVEVKRINLTTQMGKTPKIMMIGDSITNRNMAQFTKEKLVSYGINPTMVGTFVQTGNERGEGREGWEYENFIGRDNLHMGGQVIARLETGDTSTLYQNPFLKLATDEDKTNHPTWCFRNTGANIELSYAEDTDKTGDFYIFDFAWYLSSHGITAPDVVTIALSTNDFSMENATRALSNCRLAMEIMVRQIKTALPNVKIGIIPTPVYGANPTGNSRWKTAATWIEYCMKDAFSYGLNDIHIVPVYAHMDRINSFDLQNNTDLSDSSKVQVAGMNDYIHPNTVGKREYANVTAAFIANVI